MIAAGGGVAVDEDDQGNITKESTATSQQVQRQILEPPYIQKT